jgi:ribonuclease BN (tRNA processing enzyme)
MKITTLGTRGEIPKSDRRHRKHSGVLIDDNILLDLGERVFLRHRPRAIFITHLHPDHAVFVREAVHISAPIYAPERGRHELRVIAKPLSIGPYRIRPIPTRHAVLVKSCAYLVERNDERVLYTGDIVGMDRKHRKTLGTLDCVITEASFLRKGGLVRRHPQSGKLYGHAGIPDLIRLFKPHTDRIILTHFGSWFFTDAKKSRLAIASLAELHDIELIAAHDGMTINSASKKRRRRSAHAIP